jgi:hypothetical protein
MPFIAQIPGFKVPDPPDLNLGFAGRVSPKLRQEAGEAYKGAYLAGGAQGFSIGQTVGYAEGHVAGWIEAAASTSIIFGLIFFCSCVLMRLARK